MQPPALQPHPATGSPPQPSDPPVHTHRIGRQTFAFTDEAPRQSATPERCFVLVHGLPGSVRDFRWLAGPLSAFGRVIRLDLPGFGHSPQVGSGRYELQDRAGFVAEAVASLGIQKPVFVGHSMGGPVSLMAAHLWGDQTGGLGLLASVGLRPHRGFRAMPQRRFRGRLMERPLIARALGAKVREGFVKAGFPSSVSEEHCIRTLRCVGAFRFETLRRAARQLGCKTALAYCKDDPLVEWPIGQELASHLGAPICLFEDGGHNLQKTHAFAVAEFLGRQLPTP